MSAEEERLFYEKRANQGDAEAQFTLGLAYFQGVGVPKDNMKAAKWLNEAIIHGHNAAEFTLALLLTQVNEEETKREAVKKERLFYEERADQGDPEAPFILGVAYIHGVGVPKNNKDAAKWFLFCKKDPFFQRQMKRRY